MRKVAAILAAALSAAHVATAQNTTTTTTTLFSSMAHGTEFTTWKGQNVTRITVANQGGFALGDVITMSQGGISESSTIIAFGSLIVSPPFVNTFTAGASVAVTTRSAFAPFSAGNDPVAWFGKESREFWLPVGKLTPILHTPHFNMLASTFTGSPKEQWMDHIVVTNADGFKFAEIKIKKNINSFNLSKAVAENAFETIDLTLGAATKPLKEVPKDLPGGDKKYFQRMDVWLVTEKINKVFNWGHFKADQTTIGKARREAVIITSPDARILIVSSAATEYYGPVSYLAADYAHLDIHILEMKNRATVRGLLPELWGLQKMSNRTREFTCPPWSEDNCAPKEEPKAEFFSV